MTLPGCARRFATWTGAFGTKGEVAGFTVDAGIVYGYNQVHYGVVDSVITIDAVGGVVASLYFVRNPDKLTRLGDEVRLAR